MSIENWDKCTQDKKKKYIDVIWDSVWSSSLFIINEGNVLFNDTLNTFLFTIIWFQTYGKEPLRSQEMKHAATTWATLSN